MQFAHGRLDSGDAVRMRLRQAEPFVGLLDGALPPIHAFHGTDDLHAARQAPVDALFTSPALSRFGAAAIDAALLLVVDAFLVLLISWSSGIRVDALLRDAGWALGTFCAIPIALYFLLFGGIAGSTLGRYICDLIEPLHAHHVRPDHPLTLPDILRRAVGR